jgi:hypothetical protein
LPDGQIGSPSVLPPSNPVCKNISLPPSGKSNLQLPPSRSHKRGASRSSRTLGAGCSGRGSVRRARMRAGRMMLMRTVKSCGPDVPTLASSLWQYPQATVANKPGHPGRARRKPLKSLRRKRRLNPSGPVVTTLVCSITFAREAAGAASTRRFLRPLFLRVFCQSSGVSRREIEIPYLERRHCEERSDEAIHSFYARRDGLLRSARNDEPLQPPWITKVPQGAN